MLRSIIASQKFNSESVAGIEDVSYDQQNVKYFSELRYNIYHAE